MCARYLLIVANDKGYTPLHREYLLEILRRYLTVPNIRVGSNHVEVEAWDLDLSRAAEIIEKNIGRIIEWKLIEEPEIESIDEEHLIKQYVELFNKERFWEAHNVLEMLWRRTGDRNAQGLIMIAAAFIKIQENKIPEFLILAKRALEMVSDAKYFCIDLGDVKKKLAISLKNMKVFKIDCAAQG